METIFFRHHSFGSKLGTKIVENSNLALLHVPANGRVDFEEFLAYKIQLQPNETKIKNKKFKSLLP
jgi:hypothetical protein